MYTDKQGREEREKGQEWWNDTGFAEIIETAVIRDVNSGQHKIYFKLHFNLNTRFNAKFPSCRGYLWLLVLFYAF